MTTLLVRHADVLVTMDAARREVRDGGLLVRDGRIEQVGPTAELPASADETLDLSGHVVMPGLINTHHHLYQTLTRAVPAAQNANLFDWLVSSVPDLGASDARRRSTSPPRLAWPSWHCRAAPTAADHLYVFPPGCRLDDQIEAAVEVGLRFHAARGSMSLGQSKGGLPPDAVVEDEADILRDTRRLIEQFHDPLPGALLRIVVAPCSPFSVTPDLMRESTAPGAARTACGCTPTWPRRSKSSASASNTSASARLR